MSFCEVPKCGAEAHASGLCFKHYMRVRRHGSPTGGRNGDGRVKSSHPLWEGWKSMLRVARQGEGYDQRWDDFWTFVEDVGERPDPKARLYRKDREKPFSKENIEWKKPVIDISQLEDNAAYQRAFRAKNQRNQKSLYLKRHYGITIEQYEAMHRQQGDVCAICGEPEKNRHGQTGEVMMLAVDHDHDTGQNRGLLCTGCNTGIGCLGHDPARLAAALAYLERFPGDCRFLGSASQPAPRSKRKGAVSIRGRPFSLE